MNHKKEDAFWLRWESIQRYHKNFLSSSQIARISNVDPSFWVGPSRRSHQEWKIFAEHLAASNSGILPCLADLKKSKLHGLVSALHLHPLLFSHIPIERKQKNIQHWLLFAESLASKNNGVLPNLFQLFKSSHSDYVGLTRAIRLHPSRFSHFVKEPHLKEQVILSANNLASNGLLPSYSDLIHSGNTKLYRAAKRNPHKFPSLSIKKRLNERTPVEWVLVAEKLSSDNGGVLPSNFWLQSHKYSGLPSCILRHPLLFSHIRRRK